jgi:hypothetical protein
MWYKKRIGNDLRFFWTINNEGQPYFLEDKNLTLLVRDPIGPVVVSDIVYSNNVVAFTFYGKDQRKCGKHTAILIENDGDTQMRTIDIVGCVELVPHSYLEQDGNNGSNLTVDTINLESSVVIGVPGPPGKSAWQQAKEGGYTGTEQEFNTFLAGITTMHVLLTEEQYAELDNPDPSKIYMTYEDEEEQQPQPQEQQP